VSRKLRVLIVEDSEDAALLIEHELSRGGYSPECRRVQTADTMKAALSEGEWDIVISDHSMPEFSAPESLATLQKAGADIPFIIVSGSIGEDLAVRAMKSGASDFILKDSLKRLPAAVGRELADAQERRARRGAEVLLRQAEERFRLLVEQIPCVTYEAEVDTERRILFVSPQILALTGFPPDIWISQPDFWKTRIHESDRSRVESEISKMRNSGDSFSSSYRVVTRDGPVVWWQDTAHVRRERGKSSVLLRGVVIDITAQVQAEESIRHLAYHDLLTDLPNGTLIDHILGEKIATAGAGDQVLSVLAIRVLRIEEVARTLGTPVGDKLLGEIARIFRNRLPPHGVLGRTRPDGFSLILPGVGADDALRVARDLIEGAGRPILIDGVPVELECAAGLALHPGHGDDADLLLRRAEVALDTAVLDRSDVAMYDAARDPYSPKRLRLLGDLRSALASDALYLEFQPKADLNDSRVRGVEALVRWRHPVFGIVPPGDFLPAVESTALMRPLTRWIINEALRRCRAWMRAGIELPVAVNLSPRNLDDPGLPDQVFTALASWGVPAALLELEITESSLDSGGSRPKEALERFCSAGIKLAIDDFGTGHSSLKRLRSMPVSCIKIDRSFVNAMRSSRDDEAIVKASIELAHSLSLTVVAEGVEDLETWEMLAALGCDQAQGYLISMALSDSALRTWLHSSPYGLVTTAEAAIAPLRPPPAAQAQGGD
jgi:diguanylate cyclase (GGDEF)-like protein/PAS domain S-box-containing protein